MKLNRINANSTLLRQNFLYSEDANKNHLNYLVYLFKCVFDISVSLSAKEKDILSQKAQL